MENIQEKMNNPIAKPQILDNSVPVLQSEPVSELPRGVNPLSPTPVSLVAGLNKLLILNGKNPLIDTSVTKELHMSLSQIKMCNKLFKVLETANDDSVSDSEFRSSMKQILEEHLVKPIVPIKKDRCRLEDRELEYLPEGYAIYFRSNLDHYGLGQYEYIINDFECVEILEFAGFKWYKFNIGKCGEKIWNESREKPILRRFRERIKRDLQFKPVSPSWYKPMNCFTEIKFTFDRAKVLRQRRDFSTNQPLTEMANYIAK